MPNRGVFMMDMDKVVALNINEGLRNKNLKQTELASYLNISPQIVSKILSGVRSVSAFELKKISTFLNLPMDAFFENRNINQNNIMTRMFMGRITTNEGKNALKLTDELINIYLENYQFQKKNFIKNLLDYE